MSASDNYTGSEVVLRNACELVDYGYTASSSEEPIGPKFLRITDIVPDLIDWESVPHCAIEESKCDKYRLKRGDIVIARTGATTGYAKWIKDPHDAVFASYLVRLRVIPEADNRFIGYIVESENYKKFIKIHRGGAAQPNANAQVLTSYPIRLPSLDVQRRISDVLSAYDDLIENNARRIAILEEMAQAIYREWFVNFRFSGHEQVEMVESELGPVPTGWRRAALKELCNLTMGQSPKSEHYNEEGAGLPFHQGVTDFGPRFPTNRVFCTVDNRGAEKGDILFSVRAPVGRINIAPTKLVLGRGLSAIRSKDGQQDFLFYQLKNLFKEEDSMGGGTIFKSVTRADMLGISLVAPSPSVIESFEQIVRPMSGNIVNLTERNTILRETRDLLLPRLISGEIDVAALDEQLAGASA